ncbi:MAG: hypothetical protein PUB07_01920 [Clostridia bacterium]|nr:hypothetical protein [Clostridia bacterium]
MKKLFSVWIAVSLFSSMVCKAYTIHPTVKYSHAGTYAFWTEKAYYCSPTVEDIDGDGRLEIVFSNRCFLRFGL